MVSPIRLSCSRGAIICLIIVLVTTSATGAFDRQRSGLVMGAGVGPSPISTLSSSYMGHRFSGSGTGVGINVMLGYGISKRDVLAVGMNWTGYKSDYTGENANVTQGIVALTWTKYFGEVGKAYLVLAGAGAYFARSFSGISFSYGHPIADVPEARMPEDWGVGLIGGVGRELSTYFQLVAYGAIGFPSADVYVPAGGHATKTVTAAHVSILLMWMNF